MSDMREGICPKCGFNEVHYNHNIPQNGIMLMEKSIRLRTMGLSPLLR